MRNDFRSRTRTRTRTRARARVETRAGLLPAVVLAALAGGAQAAAPSADCDAPETSRLLNASAAPADARAIWLDSRQLRWPGKAADARLRLYHAPDGWPAISIGEPMPAQGRSAVLASHRGLRSEAVARRFAWFGEGQDWNVPATAFRDYAGWPGGDLLLVEEDADGRVLDLTGVQDDVLPDCRRPSRRRLSF